jgi:hypothetical protein
MGSYIQAVNTLCCLPSSNIPGAVQGREGVRVLGLVESCDGKATAISTSVATLAPCVETGTHFCNRLLT